MIGSLLAVRFLLAKPWKIAIMFWLAYIMSVSIIVSLISPEPIVIFLISLGVFLTFSTLWLLIMPKRGIVAFIATFVIDYILSMLGISILLLSDLMQVIM